MKTPKCHCQCCIKRTFMEISLLRSYLVAIQALEKIKGTPQMGLAYSIAKGAIEKIHRIGGKQ